MIRSDLCPDFFDMIPRQAVATIAFDDGMPQNSIWDFSQTREGRLFVALCGEGCVPVSGQLFEFLPGEERLRFCFDLQKACMVGARAMPPSKIHSSIDELPDGRLIMVTHNTAPAPGHPGWMMDAYYDHTWEGFAGSHLLIYDPNKDEVQNLGIPVPRESIYGGMYDPNHHAYYMMGYMRGHLYRYDLTSGDLKDLGQVTEFGSFRFARGPDGDFYSSTRSGWLFKVDVDKGCAVDMNYRLPGAPGLNVRRQCAFAATGPDGRLYITHHISNRLVALDVQSGRIEDLGCIDPISMEKNSPRCVSGIIWDDHGCLWYGISSFTPTGPGMFMHLGQWDVLRGKPPVVHGMIGTAERAACYVSEMIHANGKLYLADTNHEMDPPCLRVIDLALLEQHASDRKEICRDPVTYSFIDDGIAAMPDPEARPLVEEYLERRKPQTGRGVVKNSFVIEAERVEVFQLWRHVEPEESGVVALVWENEEVLRGYCGKRIFRSFTICQESGIVWQGESDSAPWSSGPVPEELSAFQLPSRPGRQYLARLSCCAAWKQDCYLVGTLDGLLACADLRRRTVLSLGPVCRQGPVRGIGVDASGTRAFGTAGDENDLGSCFYYDETVGVRELGRAFTSDTAPGLLGNSCVLSAAAVSPSGHKLAIGGADRLGTVYVYEHPVIPGLPVTV